MILRIILPKFVRLDCFQIYFYILLFKTNTNYSYSTCAKLSTGQYTHLRLLNHRISFPYKVLDLLFRNPHVHLLHYKNWSHPFGINRHRFSKLSSNYLKILFLYYTYRKNYLLVLRAPINIIMIIGFWTYLLQTNTALFHEEEVLKFVQLIHNSLLDAFAAKTSLLKNRSFGDPHYMI